MLMLVAWAVGAAKTLQHPSRRASRLNRASCWTSSARCSRALICHACQIYSCQKSARSRGGRGALCCLLTGQRTCGRGWRCCQRPCPTRAVLPRSMTAVTRIQRRWSGGFGGCGDFGGSAGSAGSGACRRSRPTASGC